MGLKLKTGLLAAVAVALLLSGCATVEGYRQHMDLMVGQSSDQLQLQWGPPDRTSTLSDGRKLWAYRKVNESTTGGYWTSQTRSRTETYKDANGNKQTRTVSYSEPYYEPPVTTRSVCETRFIIGTDDKVQSYSFEGNGCIAEEIKKDG